MKCPSFVILASLLSLNSWANNDLVRSQQESQHQLQQIQQYQQSRWFSQHQFQTNAASIDESAAMAKYCLPYHSLQIKGVTLINPEPFQPLPYECLNEVRLNQLSRDLTQAYLDKGYIHNPFQFEDDGSKTLILRVTEGKVAKLTGGSSQVNLAMLFPNIVGQPLNIKELDQGLDQANRLSSNQVSVDVLPAKNGEIELSFVNKPRSAISGYIGLDNFASRQYHRWQSRFGLNLDSPFGLSDSLYLGGSHTLKSTSEFNRSAILYYSIPYGRWTFNGFGSVSQFRQQIPLVYHNVEQKGRTWQAGVKVDYVAHRGSNHISTLSAQLDHLNSKNRFEDSVIILQSPTLSVAQLSFNHLQLLSQGSLIFNLDYRYGLNWWNATRNQGRDQPEGQFRKWNVDLQWVHFHSMGSQKFRRSHRLLGLYSPNYLPSLEQSDLLGRYAVRGFQDLSLSAEKSLVIQNTLSWPQQYRSLQIEPYALLDSGIQKNSTGVIHHQRAWSYGIGLQLAQTQWKANLQWARGKVQKEKHQAWEQEHQVNFIFNVFL